ncbi:lipoyl(octanoyl) transferase LipB [Psychrosphaera sp. B3R10]|uniref:lipoyl(octanoyl) transferase LipB n=1 Tax=unclassified Psychrosphaera TaxID=2641570 RepID=UPI001C083DC9|nr:MULTISPECIES: lipoyl(octanoyl) transferase LipB [unclassified Psychrosphaera]MBU2880980.1 lipoyl(octanoyl) transferase LipB [Psychrosphaera sp. I2R16]MBU2990801.1 lipoyl(octanoyl) transferase LipB [Psychrosphaera sp. B3R10]MDO6720497.1 lipoyl(octanoyl) transferase LipB [Psychrosphaera sp. 1_MG-2023]
MTNLNDKLVIRQLGRSDYEPIWHKMQDFTDRRNDDTVDELWVVEHNPVFTQGQAGKEEHLLNTGGIPVIKVDRGGQVTYHGPGQLVVYLLLNLRRRKIGVRELVTQIEQSIVDLLAQFDIEAYPKKDAPGVYVDQKKIASLGLRVRKGCSFHGLALNVDMDMEPFLRINPCGYAGLEMVQSNQIGGPSHVSDAADRLTKILALSLNAKDIEITQGITDLEQRLVEKNDEQN